MIRIIEKKEEFQPLLSLKNRVIFEDALLPSNLFRVEYKSFLFFDEGRLKNPEFLDLILKLSQLLGIEEILYMMIEPDPIRFCSNYKNYATVIFDSNSTAIDVNQYCMYSPDGSMAKEFGLIADKSALIPICEGIPDWCAYSDRIDCEVGIIAFKNKDIAEDFLKLDKEKIIGNAYTGLELITLGWRGRMPEDFKKEFLKNYDK